MFSVVVSLAMASNRSIIPELSQSPEAVQKRNYRVVQREKRRRSFFIHDYFRTKYPGLFNEANGMYQQFVDKYPTKVDFTKCYYFKKWQREMDKSRTDLMLPHLPILMSPDILQQATTKHTIQAVDQQPPEVQPPEVQQPPEAQAPEVQQPPEAQAPEVQQPPEVQAPEVQTHVQNIVEPEQLITGMSLDEMNLAVEQIVNSLQSDRELMDIVEELDLLDAVWNNELIPDYLLEMDLQW